MPKSAKYLLVGSTESHSGKSATILAIAHHLQEMGLDIAYGKPLGTRWATPQSAHTIDKDVQFVAEILHLPENRLQPTILSLDEATMQKRIQGHDQVDYPQKLLEYHQMQAPDLVLLEGPENLEEGTLFDLSLARVAEILDAGVLLVARFHSLLIVGALISAKRRLGDRLLGVLINDIPEERLAEVETSVQPYLEQRGIPILGLLPRSDLLRSVSVGELAKQLHAEVLCRSDRLDLMVESLKIGAMNVNSALKYFRKGRNMAVVTGGDRVDIQLAALETSTQCLILTGQMPPPADVLSRAEDLEIPILSVDLDTLTTVEIVDQAFGQVRVHEPSKVQYMYKLMGEHFQMDRLLEDLGLGSTVSVQQ
ncbi:phosphotransacetylase family protein [Kovacikia minuta CCNUW1]|uniref:phosphotransacetylase family protein n=1 Tax=Kovacikia minuta TaxID=2931930 RepID=UPI001CCC6423|nr:phosphotransacetylase family protein [Kovacikia minuta]UBF26130.1 phosphotransacetylase family protein [Kovacikia minuta CCNUW1]